MDDPTIETAAKIVTAAVARAHMADSIAYGPVGACSATAKRGWTAYPRSRPRPSRADGVGDGHAFASASACANEPTLCGPRSVARIRPCASIAKVVGSTLTP